MGGLILGVNTLYRLFCFFKLFPVVGTGLSLVMLVTDSGLIGLILGINTMYMLSLSCCLIGCIEVRL